MATDLEVYGDLAMEVDEVAFKIRAAGKDFSVHLPSIRFAWLLLRRLSKYESGGLLTTFSELCEENGFQLVLETRLLGGFRVLPAGILTRLLIPALRRKAGRGLISV